MTQTPKIGGTYKAEADGELVRTNPTAGTPASTPENTPPAAAKPAATPTTDAPGDE